MRARVHARPLQARFLTHLPDPPEGLRRARSTATGVDELPPAIRRRVGGTAAGSYGNGGGGGTPEGYPHARVPPLVGRGVQRMRDVVRLGATEWEVEVGGRGCWGKAGLRGRENEDTDATPGMHNQTSVDC